MSNGDFQKGTWNELPTNCTRSFTLTWWRCAEYGMVGVTRCITWAISVQERCIKWAWNIVKECSSWGWIFCLIFAIVATLVCTVFELVVVIVCVVVAVVVIVVCLLWTPISMIFCASEQKGGTAFLLTDGTVMMQEFRSIFGANWASRRWWKLTPDQSGRYRNGSWSQLADSHVARTYFASSVLADGRVVICGAEYSDVGGTILMDWDNSCEIYDPITDQWTVFEPPSNPGTPATPWKEIGDGVSTVLPDGTFLLGSVDNQHIAKLDPSTLTWTTMKDRPGVSTSDEDSWVLMPNNTVVGPSCPNPPTTWVYDIEKDKWTQGNSLPVSVVDAASEIGPALLRYDGTAFFLGANQHTAIYSPAGNPQWTNGGDLPQEDGKNLGIADGPAALLVNGNILFGAAPIDSSGSFLSPCFYFEFDGVAFMRTNDPPFADGPAYATRLLLLPDGDILFCQETSSSFYAYHSDTAEPQDSFRPLIQNCPRNLVPGSTIQISGLQFNGLSQAVAYGDDAQTATNYPLVRVVHKASEHVRYCRTFDHTTVDSNGTTRPSMGVATGNAVITTNVEIPRNLELGDSTLFVVVNGIQSQPFEVTVSQDGGGSVLTGDLNDPGVIN